jgi:hypothetical protein
MIVYAKLSNGRQLNVEFDDISKQVCLVRKNDGVLVTLPYYFSDGAHFVNFEFQGGTEAERALYQPPTAPPTPEPSLPPMEKIIRMENESSYAYLQRCAQARSNYDRKLRQQERQRQIQQQNTPDPKQVAFTNAMTELGAQSLQDRKPRRGVAENQ